MFVGVGLVFLWLRPGRLAGSGRSSFRHSSSSSSSFRELLAQSSSRSFLRAVSWPNSSRVWVEPGAEGSPTSALRWTSGPRATHRPGIRNGADHLPGSGPGDQHPRQPVARNPAEYGADRVCRLVVVLHACRTEVGAEARRDQSDRGWFLAAHDRRNCCVRSRHADL